MLSSHGFESNNAGSLFPFTLSGSGAHVVLDFGKNVGGFIAVTFGAATAGQECGLAYSESTNYAVCPSSSVSACADGAGQAGAGDHSNGGSGPDGTLSTGRIKSQSTYRPSLAHLRGGFRYLNLFLKDTSLPGGSVEIANVSLHFTAAPTMVRAALTRPVIGGECFHPSSTPATPLSKSRRVPSFLFACLL